MGYPIGNYAAVEAAIGAAGATLGDLCARVPIAHSTWSRWKSGKTGGPNVKQWANVERAVAELCAEHKHADAPARQAPTGFRAAGCEGAA